MAIVEKAAPIILADRSSVAVNAPDDPELATLWRLALAKAEAAIGKAPTTRAEVRGVLDEYHRLMAKARGSIADIVRERCAQVSGGD